MNEQDHFFTPFLTPHKKLSEQDPKEFFPGLAGLSPSEYLLFRRQLCVQDAEHLISLISLINKALYCEDCNHEGLSNLKVQALAYVMARDMMARYFTSLRIPVPLISSRLPVGDHEITIVERAGAVFIDFVCPQSLMKTKEMVDEMYVSVTESKSISETEKEIMYRCKVAKQILPLTPNETERAFVDAKELFFELATELRYGKKSHLEFFFQNVNFTKRLCTERIEINAGVQPSAIFLNTKNNPNCIDNQKILGKVCRYFLQGVSPAFLRIETNMYSARESIGLHRYVSAGNARRLIELIEDINEALLCKDPAKATLCKIKALAPLRAWNRVRDSFGCRGTYISTICEQLMVDSSTGLTVYIQKDAMAVFFDDLSEISKEELIKKTVHHVMNDPFFTQQAKDIVRFCVKTNALFTLSSEETETMVDRSCENFDEMYQLVRSALREPERLFLDERRVHSSEFYVKASNCLFSCVCQDGSDSPLLRYLCLSIANAAYAELMEIFRYEISSKSNQLWKEYKKSPRSIEMNCVGRLKFPKSWLDSHQHHFFCSILKEPDKLGLCFSINEMESVINIVVKWGVSNSFQWAKESLASAEEKINLIEEIESFILNIFHAYFRPEKCALDFMERRRKQKEIFLKKGSPLMKGLTVAVYNRMLCTCLHLFDLKPLEQTKLKRTFKDHK
jgi:hypothetical protein